MCQLTPASRMIRPDKAFLTWDEQLSRDRVGKGITENHLHIGRSNKYLSLFLAITMNYSVSFRLGLDFAPSIDRIVKGIDFLSCTLKTE